jgi:hypothetical protein
VDLDFHDDQQRTIVDHVRLEQLFRLIEGADAPLLDPARPADMARVVAVAWKLLVPVLPSRMGA